MCIHGQEDIRAFIHRNVDSDHTAMVFYEDKLAVPQVGYWCDPSNISQIAYAADCLSVWHPDQAGTRLEGARLNLGDVNMKRFRLGLGDVTPADLMKHMGIKPQPRPQGDRNVSAAADA